MAGIVENPGFECGLGGVPRYHCLSSTCARSLWNDLTVETAMSAPLEMSILSQFLCHSDAYADNYPDIMSAAHIFMGNTRP
jgi:hypothetical protein